MNDRNEMDRTDSLLQQWMDGELPEAEQVEVEALIDSDEQARKQMEDYNRIGDWARQSRGLEQIEPTAEEFWKRLKTQLPAKEPGWKRIWRRVWEQGSSHRFQVGFATAAVLLMLVVAFQLTRPVEPITTVQGPIENEPACIVKSVSTEVPEATLLAYQSEPEGLTVIWLFAENGEPESTPDPVQERQI